MPFQWDKRLEPSLNRHIGSSVRQFCGICSIYGIRFEERDYAVIEERARKAELPVAEYCRKAILGKRIIVKQETVVDISVVKELIAALGKIGANLNQIAHHFNVGGVLSQRMYKETMKAYADLYAMKFEIEKFGGEFRSHPEAYGRKEQRPE